MEQLDDEQLLRRAVAGDCAAAEAALIAHQVRLLRYVQGEFPSSLRAFTTPEDVVQEVYVKAYGSVGTLRASGPDGVFSWMAAIARNTLVDLQRRFALRRAEDLAGGGGDDVVRLLERLVVYRRTPSQSAAEHEFMAAVEDSLEQLPENYHMVVRLRHVDGLSVAETAARLNTTAEAVHKLCNRGLTALRVQLESASRVS